MRTDHPRILSLLLTICLLGLVPRIFAQAECNVWGGLRGIRVEGELIAFTTGLRAVPPDAAPVGRPGLERLIFPSFSHETNTQVSSGAMWPIARNPNRFFFTRPRGVSGRVSYQDAGPGLVNVEVDVSANTNVSLAGAYYYIHVRGPDYSGATVQPLGGSNGFQITAAHRQIEADFDSPVDFLVKENRTNENGGLVFYFPICVGGLTNGQTAHLKFTLKASGEIDKTPVQIAVDLRRPGSPFEGIGGNIRIQSPADPQEVQYNLDHLHLVWARVSMPLDRWRPDEAAETTNVSEHNTAVRQAMDTARTLNDKKIPLMISLWSMPRWALSPPTNRPNGDGQTSHLNPEKWDAICQSIGSYLDCLKRDYGVEPRLFSFNETDIGYQVLQTPQEHADAIKRLGAYFAAKGLVTKMVLGDTGDPTGVDFINAAMSDPDAVKYLAAVSYHAWRGGTVEQYTRWGGAARRLGLPLLIAEGGTDADAYRYQALLLEPWYALNEIGEYIDICRYSQPACILEWQLTHDYSLLTGGKEGRPLQPAQRFWQLKQLDLTPHGAAAIPVTCDKPAISACAFADATRGGCAVHLVNVGPARSATISGLPANIQSLRAYATDGLRGMQELTPVKVSDGAATFTLDAMCYLTLVSAP